MYDVINTVNKLCDLGPSPLDVSHTEAQPPAHPQRTARLPKITLPTFDGDILEFQTFWDRFETINSDVTLTAVTKFSYLQAQLRGEALLSVKGLSLTDANYLAAVDTLKQRYGQTNKIIRAHMRALYSMHKPSDNPKNLREFFDKNETHLRALKALGKNSESFGDLLVPILIDKLPSTMRKNLARIYKGSDYSLDDLRESLRQEIEILEEGIFDPQIAQDTYQTNNRYYSNKQIKFSPTAAALHTGTNYTWKRKPLPCIYCGGTHSSSKCTIIENVTERLNILETQSRCTNCFSQRHQHSNCTSNIRCNRCKQKHHTSICTQSTTNRVDKDNQATPSTSAQVNISKVDTNTTFVLLKTAEAQVITAEGTSSMTQIMFDEGSQRTFITRDLANKLRCKITSTETVSISTFGGKSTAPKQIDKVSIAVKTNSENILISALVVDHQITTPMHTPIRDGDLKRFKYLSTLKLANRGTSPSLQIELLIGADYYWKFIEDHVVRGDGPTAVKSKLGYLLSGPVPTMSMCGVITTLKCAVNTKLDNDTNQLLQNLWSLEAIGIQESPIEEKEFIEEYSKNITFENGRYTAMLPWNCTPENRNLPSNYKLCFNRLQSNLKRLRKDSQLLKHYHAVIKEQLRKGFIELVIEDQEPADVHYIPHHCVVKDSATTPVRIVYDCSAKLGSHSKSLNDHLLSGPSTINDPVSILLRFRIHKYGFISDVEKAFLQIRLHESDRNFTRFLWPDDPENPLSPIHVYRFCTILFGATSSPFILGATIGTHLNSQAMDKICADIRQNIYVDNILSGGNSTEETIAYKTESQAIFKSGGFNLRNWISNNAELTDDHNTKHSTLGLIWDSSTDILELNQKIPRVDANTKREILQQSNTIYDPLGLISPITIRNKLLLQQLWKESYGWDDTLPQELQDIWNSIATDTKKICKEFQIPRQYFNLDTTKEVTLHIFADSSKKAFGAVVYLTQGQNTAIVLSKARPAPIKEKTLPQLELMAATIAARISKYVNEAFSSKLHVKETHFWTDSQITLHWIASTKKLKTFVENRVKEIRQISKIEQWHYCPTKDNPADILTRGISSFKESTMKLWCHGPYFLIGGKWPTWPITQLLTTTQTEDLTKTPKVITKQKPNDKKGQTISNIISMDRFSSFSKLVRVTAYVIRFIKMLQHKTTTKDFLTVQELDNAEKMWFQAIQQEHFKEEYNSLLRNSRDKPLIRTLRLTLYDGLITCSGRIHNAPLTQYSKFPILLPRQSYLTNLIINDMHKQTCHQGVNATLTHLRTRFWIPKCRQTIKKAIQKCIICRRLGGPHFNMPDSPPLPKFRVQQAPPFYYTGVDFTGYLFVKEKGKERKVYICLYTCAVTRNIHLELVSDLTCNSFLLSFRRFCARRSTPRIMISDNASTYKAAASQLQTMFDSPEMQEHLLNIRTEWHFIPSRAPWFGGFWERLIGITKTAIKKVLGRASISFEELNTLVTEIESVLNDRPLTFVSSDINDDEPLTPAHLMYGRRITTLPRQDLSMEDLRDPTYNDVLNMEKRSSVLFQHFWKRWRTEYLTALLEHQQRLKRSTNTNIIKAGDVVIIHDETSRLLWKLGIIIDIVKGKDGMVRSATLKSKQGTISRPISKLYPLELTTSIRPCDPSDTVSDTDDITKSRSTRPAAEKAKAAIQHHFAAPEDVEETQPSTTNTPSTGTVHTVPPLF